MNVSLQKCVSKAWMLPPRFSRLSDRLSRKIETTMENFAEHTQFRVQVTRRARERAPLSECVKKLLPRLIVYERAEERFGAAPLKRNCQRLDRVIDKHSEQLMSVEFGALLIPVG